MKWFTHQSLAIASAVVLEMPTAAISGVVLGSILPDLIDQGIARLSPYPQKTFNAIHRGLSHWFGWYGIILLCAFCLEPSFFPKEFGRLREDIRFACLGMAFGALYHIALDMFTPSGVPLSPWNTKKRFSWRLFSTGSTYEYMFLATALSIHAVLGYDAAPTIARMVQRLL